MTVVLVAEATIGDALTSTTAATAAATAAVGVSLPEVTAKLAGYTKLSIPSPSFSIEAQAAVAATALTNITAQLAAMPGGVGLASGLTLAVAGVLAAQAAIKGFSPTLSVDIDAAVGAVLGIKAAISAGVSGPNINMAVVSAQITELTGLLATLQAQLALSVSINAKLGAAGLCVYRFDGEFANAGAELQSRLTADGFSGSGHFIALAPRTEATWGALQGTVRAT